MFVFLILKLNYRNVILKLLKLTVKLSIKRTTKHNKNFKPNRRIVYLY